MKVENKNGVWNFFFIFVILISFFAVGSYGGPPEKLISLWQSSSTNELSLSWIYPTQDTVTYKPIMSIPQTISISNNGKILAAKNSTSVFFPSFDKSSSQTTIFVCNTKTEECEVEATLSHLQLTSLSYDTKTKELFFIALNTTTETTNEFTFLAGFLIPSITNPPSSFTLISQINDVTTSAGFPPPEGTLGPLSYYVLWFDTGKESSFGYYFDRTTNETSNIVTFSPSKEGEPFIPSNVVYNFNSLTNTTGTCSIPVSNGNAQSLTIQTCSVDYRHGTTSLPLNGHLWNFALPVCFY